MEKLYIKTIEGVVISAKDIQKEYDGKKYSFKEVKLYQDDNDKLITVRTPTDYKIAVGQKAVFDGVLLTAKSYSNSEIVYLTITKKDDKLDK